MLQGIKNLCEALSSRKPALIPALLEGRQARRSYQGANSLVGNAVKLGRFNEAKAGPKTGVLRAARHLAMRSIPSGRSYREHWSEVSRD